MDIDIAGLPQPDPAGREHSRQLVELICQRVQQGKLSFADYMQMVLYEPGLGYYMAGAQKFGAGGDFVTAPNVSSVFGECIGVQCRDVLDVVGGGILELGAGSGQLAASVMKSLKDAPPEQYLILETSAELQYRQRQFLSQELAEDLYRLVEWITALPDKFNGVLLANEVMDALPTEVFVKSGGEILQLFVEQSADGFITRAGPPTERLLGAVRSLETELGREFYDGYQSEVCLLLTPWIEALAGAMQNGVLLLSDYGYPRREYYLAERTEGTLACYYRHHCHSNVFFHPGLQDITAHVDFTRVVETASKAGLELLGYTSQSSFLLNTGIGALAASKMESGQSDVERLTLSREIKTLTLPGEMGERFQFMALGKNLALPLQGFATQEMSHRL